MAKTQIRVESALATTTFEYPALSEYFDVTLVGTPANGTPNEVVFSAEIPSEFHVALKHLAKHGTLTERFLANCFGASGPRKARQFADKISTWVPLLPFNFVVELTAEGKTYRKTM